MVDRTSNTYEQDPSCDPRMLAEEVFHVIEHDLLRSEVESVSVQLYRECCAHSSQRLDPEVLFDFILERFPMGQEGVQSFPRYFTAGRSERAISEMADDFVDHMGPLARRASVRHNDPDFDLELSGFREGLVRFLKDYCRGGVSPSVSRLEALGIDGGYVSHGRFSFRERFLLIVSASLLAGFLPVAHMNGGLWLFQRDPQQERIDELHAYLREKNMRMLGLRRENAEQGASLVRLQEQLEDVECKLVLDGEQQTRLLRRNKVMVQLASLQTATYPFITRGFLLADGGEGGLLMIEHLVDGIADFDRSYIGIPSRLAMDYQEVSLTRDIVERQLTQDILDQLAVVQSPLVPLPSHQEVAERLGKRFDKWSASQQWFSVWNFVLFSVESEGERYLKHHWYPVLDAEMRRFVKSAEGAG